MANILVVIPYAFYPPHFGGALRCFHLLKEIAKYHEVFLLTVQPSAHFKTNAQPTFPENVTILSTREEKKIRTIFNLLPLRYANAINSRIIQRDLFKTGNQFLLDSYLIVKKLFSSEKIDYVIYENMQCFGALYPTIKKMSPSVKHIYDAHNVDSALWKAQAAISGNKELLKYSKSALSVEKNFYNTFSLVFSCSENDKSEFDKLNQNRANVVMIANGVDTDAKTFDINPHKQSILNILFCGALDYGPNTEGILWFHEKIFPLVKAHIPGIKFTVIGKMHREGPYEALKKDESVHFIGPVADVSDYYRQSSLLVVPLLKGSGTRLKILEAMSMGNPVVSTSVGVEGLKALPGKHFMLADSQEAFAKAIVLLLQQAELFDEMRCEARRLVEERYDWNTIGKEVKRSIALLPNINYN